MSADDHLQAERHASAMGIQFTLGLKAVQEEAEELAMLEDRPAARARDDTGDAAAFADLKPGSQPCSPLGADPSNLPMVSAQCRMDEVEERPGGVKPFVPTALVLKSDAALARRAAGGSSCSGCGPTCSATPTLRASAVLLRGRGKWAFSRTAFVFSWHAHTTKTTMKAPRRVGRLDGWIRRGAGTHLTAGRNRGSSTLEQERKGIPRRDWALVCDG